MAQVQLGLFDTPPNQQEIRFSFAVVGLLFAALCFAFPMRNVPLYELSIYIPLIDAFMLFSELVIATLLFSQASVFRSKALVVLASGYLFIALILVPHALTFPQAFSPDGLLGAGVNTTAWLAVFRRFAFPLSIIIYALLKTSERAGQSSFERRRVPVMEGVFAAIGAAALATLLTTLCHDWLPPIFSNLRDTVRTSLVIINAVTILLTITAMILLSKRQKSVLDIWLMVALSGWIFQSILNLTLQSRYTLGWYGLSAMTLAASVIVMLALIGEANRLYARSALHVAQREREHDSRLMSMEAVAAAMAHEIGQPVAAARLSAAAAIELLDRKKPQPDEAIRSLRMIVNDCGRTFDVMKSMREMFAKNGERLSEFSFNDLVLETCSLLERALAARKVSLQLDLEHEVPLFLGNRTQLQRVLINLLTNAIDSVGATRRRDRKIQIRMLPSEDHIQIEISDSGLGLKPDDIARIFEPFFTTKSKGTGLGLSLSRTIIEEHGGRLWVSPGEKHGAVFHLRLPLDPSRRLKVDRE